MPYELLDDSSQGRYEMLPASVKAGKELNSIPRQLGLTARYGLEGPAQAAQIFTEPVAGLMRLAGIKTKPLGEVASGFADMIGLPKPEGANERVIGDATRMVAGAGGFGGAAGLVGKLPGMAGQVGSALAANPLQQLGTATGAGLAGGASREAGGSDLQQAGAALLGGVAGGGAVSAAQGGVNLAKTLFNRGMTAPEYDVKISNVLRQAGVDYNQVPERARQALRTELASALQANKELDPAAVSRLLAFKEAGVTPTRGMVSQNPVQITREMNLAKIGANSSDEGLQGLALMQNQNNNRLIGNLNTLGANKGDVNRAGERVTSSILGTQAGLRGEEQALWNAAKASPGYTQPIGAGVLSDINRALDAEGMMPFMNPQISKYIEAFQSGAPFTPQAYRNLQSMLSRETAKGGNEAFAAGIASRILRDSDLTPAGFSNAGNLPVTQGMAAGMRAADGAANESIAAVNQARNATRQAYAYEESSPLVRSVLSDGRTSDPQRIAQSYIIGGTAREAQDIVQQVGPQGVGEIKNALLAHLKDKAVSGADDEAAKFSQSAFNKALNAIGDQKLALFFSPEEIRALQVNGRVAALMQSQPVGSAVNNSNSGALLLGRGGDMLAGLAGKLPFGQQMLADPMQNIAISLRQRQAQNVMPGLLAEQPKQMMGQSMIVPGLAFGGGLLSTAP